MKLKNKIKSKFKTAHTFFCDKIREMTLVLIPKTRRQRELEENLRQEFSKLKEVLSTEKITGVWSDYSNNLQKYIKEKEVRSFLRWDIIEGSMFHIARAQEFNFLKSLKDWSTWRVAMKESKVGNPKAYRDMHQTSGNMVHYAYHVSLLFNKFQIKKQDIHKVFEFGGGYGGMALLFSRLLPKCSYSIFDLPEFSALQKYYLQSNDLSVSLNEKSLNDIALFNNLELLKNQPLHDVDIFVATWSLSETPLDFRDKVLSLTLPPKYYLIAYQKKFKEINNSKYFHELEKSMPDYEWKHFDIEHLLGNSYLLGKKK